MSGRSPRSLCLQAIHRPGVNNELAGYLSRNHPDPTEWHLLPLVAQHLFQYWFSRTGHPMVAASNALSQSWTGLYLFAYPPIPLLEKTLIKIREDQVNEVIVIAPTWARRSWYHLLLQMVCEIPFWLPHRHDLLSQCLPDKLTAWKLSGVPFRTKAFRCSYCGDSLYHP